MANGGFQPAVNLQLATDTASRAIVGVMLSNEGNDAANLSGPMRQQVQQRLGKKVEEHLIDGGFLSYEDIAERMTKAWRCLCHPSQPAARKNAAMSWTPSPPIPRR